jgi:hypothetical protein
MSARVASQRPLVAAPTLAVGLVAVVVAVASAQDLPRRPVAVAFDEHAVPRVDVEASDLADAEMRRALDRGLPQTLLTRVYAHPSDGSAPVAIAFQSCAVAFDVWELTYRVRIQTASSDETETIASIDRVVDACLDLRALRIGQPRDWVALGDRSWWVEVVVELNPVSPETVHRIRRWLSRPDGAGVEGDAFFGSFVSLFVTRRIGEAERTLRYRSASEVRRP